MAVKPGYKQTEVGVIPQDWKDSRLGDCGEVIMGQSPPGSSYNRKGVGSPLINGPTEFTDRYPIKIQWTTQPARFCKTGDLLICVRGSSTGRTNYANGTYAIGRGVAAIRAKDNNDTEYLSYQVISGVSDILAAATGSTFPSVDGASFRKIVVPLPSPAEQRAIAGALSDVDALIGALDTALAKKRDLKQAAMQQLLTGQKRLPGFHGEWEAKRLGDVGVFSKGRGIKKDEVVADGLPCVRYGEIYTHHNDHLKAFNSFITPETAKQSQRLQKGDLLFAGSGETAEEIGKCIAFLGDEEAYAGGDIVIFRPVGQDSKFLGFLMNHSSVASQKARMGQGDAVVHISARNLARLELHLPSLPEQTAIAEVLSDMDAELAALTQRRDKTRALKQGMMQELLTGRIRLV
jgi:type I restriction enzyme S subunit